MDPSPDDATSDYEREESESEQLDRNWDELLQELRITQTGLQLLSGFLLTLPFTQIFPSLDQRQKGVYLALVIVAGIGVGLNMTPVMLHRRVFRERRKDRVVAVGHVLIQVVMAAIAVLIVGMTMLIFSVVANWTAGLIAGTGLVIALVLLLGVVPRRLQVR